MSISKWRYTEECNGRPCPGDCDHCSFEPGDLISRADAIEAVQKIVPYVIDNDTGQWGILVNKANVITELSALPSADVKPTVVRCKTMIPYGDFREWAKRIREDNPNVIVIPFDAEVASADADTDDLIIKGAKGIQDGLYNIKDGKLFQYKAKGGTVRTYQIIKGGDDE